MAFDGNERHTLSVHSGKHTQYNNCCVKFVLKHCDDLLKRCLHEKLKIIQLSAKKVTLFSLHTCTQQPTIINGDLPSIGLYQI